MLFVYTCCSLKLPSNCDLTRDVFLACKIMEPVLTGKPTLMRKVLTAEGHATWNAITAWRVHMIVPAIACNEARSLHRSMSVAFVTGTVHRVLGVSLFPHATTIPMQLCTMHLCVFLHLHQKIALAVVLWTWTAQETVGETARSMFVECVKEIIPLALVALMTKTPAIINNRTLSKYKNAIIPRVTTTIALANVSLSMIAAMFVAVMAHRVNALPRFPRQPLFA